MNGFLHRVRIEGLMPERALLKLKRNGIPLYDIQKTAKDRLECSVKSEHLDKLFALYPRPEHRNGYAAFTATDLGVLGWGKRLQRIRARVGLVLGALLFCMGTLWAQTLTFDVEFVGSSVYAREALQALDEYGLRRFNTYKTGNEDLVCARLLTIPDVEFCSVQKVGTRVRVEMRLYALPPQKMTQGDMRALHTGTVLSMTALRGTPAKKVGDKIARGETLVHGWYFVEGRGQVSVEVIARASIACVYETEIQAQSEEEAFAQAYLDIALQDGETLTKKELKKTENGFFVRMEYTAIESVNL